MAVAEQRGPLRSVRDLLMVKASTGIGSSIVSGGALQARLAVRRRRARPYPDLGTHRGALPVRPDRLPRGRRRRLGHRQALQQLGRDVRHVRDVVAIAAKGDLPAALGMIRDAGRRVGGVLAAAGHSPQPRGRRHRRRPGRRLRAVRRRAPRDRLPALDRAVEPGSCASSPPPSAKRQGLVGCAAMISQRITSERAVDAAIADRRKRSTTSQDHSANTWPSPPCPAGKNGLPGTRSN